MACCMPRFNVPTQGPPGTSWGDQSTASTQSESVHTYYTIKDSDALDPRGGNPNPLAGRLPGPVSSCHGGHAGMFTACGDVFARGTTLPSTLPAWQSPVVCSLPIPEQGNADSSHFWTLPGVNFGQQFPLCVSAGPILTMPGVPFLSTVPPVVLVPSSRSPSALSRVRKFCKKQSSKIWTIVAICIVVSLLIVLAYPDNHAQRARLMHVPHETNVKVVSGHTSSNHDLRTTSSHHPISTLSTVTTMTTGVSSFAPSSTPVSETTGVGIAGHLMVWVIQECHHG
ncbi:hypothetical protein Bbelb_225800 [Branchiostoma belcheri]|nr:hypothetical protein Bbelb_225800 [Branchiostoma belcheri]